jgi:hypothetical protein
MVRALLLLLVVAGPSVARAAPGYEWLTHPPGERLSTRYAPPPGASRVPVAAGSFGAWLRDLPLRAAGTPVHLFDGREKPNQAVHAAVIDLDVPPRDLQQCADAVMRLRAEYLRARRQQVVFHPEPGKPKALVFAGGDRKQFDKYLIRVFADAGSASLQAELTPVGARPVEPGDVLIQGGYPGHAVLVLDVAAAPDGRRYLLLGQSYMPAQEFHLLVNPEDAALSPWYDAAALETGLRTPEWRPFTRKDVRRFRP